MPGKFSFFPVFVFMLIFGLRPLPAVAYHCTEPAVVFTLPGVEYAPGAPKPKLKRMLALHAFELEGDSLPKHRKRKKFFAAVLAFPFPFGIVGLHRIYLGTAPYVPVVYIATAGGVFGLLPLIDFISILAEKDLNRFVAKEQVFMWVE